MTELITFNKNQDTLLPLAKDCIQAGHLFADKFRKVIHFIRDFDMPPKEVAAVLKEAGWTDSRISEVKAITYAPPDVWKEYATGKLGWRPALEAAREAKPSKEKRKQPTSKFFKILNLHVKLATRNPKLAGISTTPENFCIVGPMKSGNAKRGKVTISWTVTQSD